MQWSALLDCCWIVQTKMPKLEMQLSHAQLHDVDLPCMEFQQMTDVWCTFLLLRQFPPLLHRHPLPTPGGFDNWCNDISWGRTPLQRCNRRNTSWGIWSAGPRRRIKLISVRISIMWYYFILTNSLILFASAPFIYFLLTLFKSIRTSMQYFGDGFSSYSLWAAIADSVFAPNATTLFGADLPRRRTVTITQRKTVRR